LGCDQKEHTNQILAMIVSIYADSKKQTDKLIEDIKKQLIKRKYKVDALVIKLGTAPKNSKNPYINASYDTHSRYKYLNQLNKYVGANNVLLVQGQIIDTILREAKNLKNTDEIPKYTQWLMNSEFVSYSLPQVDLCVITSENNTVKEITKTLSKLPELNNKILLSKNTSKIVETIIKPKKKTHHSKLNLYECLQIRANHAELPIVIQDASKAKMANKDLDKLREKYIAKLGINSYGAFISLPLSTITNISKINNNLPKTHNYSTEKVVEAIAKESFYPKNDQKIKPTFLNEIEFTAFVGKIYNAQLDLIGLNKRRRLLETVVNNIDGNNIGTTPFYNFEGKISYYDFLLLTNIITLNAEWEIPSAKYGFVDVGDEAESNSLEEIFDQSTFIISTSKNNNPISSLLLGHINYFYLNLDLTNTIKLLKKGNKLKGSEYLSKYISELINDFSNRFPVLFETIKS
jgi:hypothetical protein